MKFSYEAYRSLIRNLKEKNYSFADYSNCDDYDRCVILRHDIDYSLDKAVRMAEVEAEEGVSSTYFVLMTSEFYNVLAKENVEKILQIYKLGHRIGLHFDEVNYTADAGDVETLIKKEIEIMEKILGICIDSVSMHRPSPKTLEADYKFENLVNSYGKKFFKDFKYVSDSRRRWREDVEAIVEACEYDKLHILTHAFWYDDQEKSLEESIKRFVVEGNVDRYDILERNITDLESILKKEAVLI